MEESPSLVELLEARESEMTDSAFNYNPFPIVQYVSAPAKPKRIPRKIKKERKKYVVRSLIKTGWDKRKIRDFYTFSKTVVPVFKPFNI